MTRDDLHPGEFRKNFEALLGPIEAAADALPHLLSLAPFQDVADDLVGDAIETTTAFLTKLHRLGLGIVLKHIAEQSVAPVDEAAPGHDKYQNTVCAWMKEVLELDTGGEALTIGTLNYDGLLHAAALDATRVADLVSGLSEPISVPVVDGGRPIAARPVRSHDDLPDGRLQILNLHGALGWVREPVTDIVWKFRLADLRSERFWDAFKEGRTEWKPTVVLGDRKASAVRAAPFSLAYEIFLDRLIEADRWMIVGYGFGDRPLNVTISEAYRAKNRTQREALRLLVIDYGRDQWAAHVARLLGLPDSCVTTDVTGIPTAIGGEAWKRWAQ